MKKLIICLSLLIASVPASHAGDITLSASVARNVVGLDEQLVLNVSVSGAASGLPEPKIPELRQFAVYRSGQSQNYSFINGKISSSVSFTYVLAPREPGKFTLPPVTLEFEGKTWQTRPIPVEVLPAGGQASPGAAPSVALPADSNGQKEFFVTAAVDKHQVRVNEQVTYTFRFFRRVRTLSSPQYSPPDFSGFFSEELPPRNSQVSINGQPYAVSELKTFLFPTKPGTFTVGAAALQVVVEDAGAGDPFSGDFSFFGGFFNRGAPRTLRTNPLKITVTPLPQRGKPASFSGAVGSYRVSAELDKNEAVVNEPVTLSVTVSGTGNIKALPEPGLPGWPDLRKYDTVSSLTIERDENGVRGSKTFKTVLVPSTPGRKTIPPVSFSYFDPSLGAYRTVHTPELALEVKPGEPGAAPSTGPPSAAAEGVKVLNRDIRYIKSPARWREYGGPLYRNPWFIALNIFPLLVLGGAFGYRRWQDRLRSDVAYARRLRASGVARKYLRRAKNLLDAGENAAFYASIARSLLEFIAHKANVSPDGLTCSSLSGLLAQRNVRTETAAAVREILDECDLARFAPTQVTPEMMRGVYEKAETVINELAKEFR